jgi:hypothetical protein
VSLANLQKGPAKRGYRSAATHDEHCKSSFTVNLSPDDGMPLANRWVLSTHGVDPSMCATHTHHPMIHTALLPNYIGDMNHHEKELA